MHALTIASTSQAPDTSPVVQAAVVPVVAIAIISVVIIGLSTGGVLG